MIKKLIKKFMNRETISYLLFGILTTIVDLVIYRAALKLGIHYLIAQGIAWMAAVAFAFITNKLFVFESKTTEKSVVVKELISFVGARIVSGMISALMLVFFVEVCALSEMAAKLITQIFVVIANYVFSKLFIFRKH